MCTQGGFKREEIRRNYKDAGSKYSSASWGGGEPDLAG